MVLPPVPLRRKSIASSTVGLNLPGSTVRSGTAVAPAVRDLGPPDAHLAGAGVLQVDLLHDERGGELLEDGGEVLHDLLGLDLDVARDEVHLSAQATGPIGEEAGPESRPVDVPDDYVQINSGLGESAPLNIIVLPVLFALVTALLATLALPLGPLLRSMPPLQAYGWDIAGSMIGIAAVSSSARSCFSMYPPSVSSLTVPATLPSRCCPP